MAHVSVDSTFAAEIVHLGVDAPLFEKSFGGAERRSEGFHLISHCDKFVLKFIESLVNGPADSFLFYKSSRQKSTARPSWMDRHIVKVEIWSVHNLLTKTTSSNSGTSGR